MLETLVYQSQQFFKVKQNRKNLKSEECTSCLISYFDDSKSLSHVT